MQEEVRSKLAQIEADIANYQLYLLNKMEEMFMRYLTTGKSLVENPTYPPDFTHVHIPGHTFVHHEIQPPVYTVKIPQYQVDAKELSLVPGLVLPPKFKVSDFEKYNGTTCPSSHITMYCRRIDGYMENGKLLIQCFQDSLYGHASKWIRGSDSTDIEKGAEMFSDDTNLHKLNGRVDEFSLDARFRPGTASEASYPVHDTNLDQWKPKSAQNSSVNSSPVHVRRVSIVYLAMRRGVCRRLPNRIANPLKVWGVFGRVEEMTLGVYLGFLNARVDGQSELRLPRRLNGGRDRDLVRCSFRSLEFVNATFLAKGRKIPKPRLSDCTKMGLKLTLGRGAKVGKGLGRQLQRLVNPICPIIKRDRFGLGYQPTPRDKLSGIKKGQEMRKARLAGEDLSWEPMIFPPLSSIFISRGHMFQGNSRNTEVMVEYALGDLGINVITDDEFEEIIVMGIYPAPPGFVLNNWTAEELPVVYKSFTESSDIYNMNANDSDPEIDFEKPICQGEIEDCDDDEGCELPSELLKMVENEDKQILPHKESIEILNLGTDEDKREIKIGTTFTEEGWESSNVCVDYRDLNRASPKDNFPLPHIDTLVDNTAGNSLFSFMDGFSGYNQIKMNHADMEKMTFVTMWGMFCYKVMSFGLKNVGATYQRAMLLGFVVSQKGIEIDPDKVKAIQDLPAPRTQKEVRGFLGRLNYIARFISQLTEKCDPIFRLLRKNNSGEWSEDCQRAFEEVKRYLSSTPILVPPIPGKPLILYLSVYENSMGFVLGQRYQTEKKERAIYYLSKKFTECETRYSHVEKLCCALISSLADLIIEFDIQYVNQAAIKGSAIAKFIASRASEEYESLSFDFPDEDLMAISVEETVASTRKYWKLNFDGASNAMVHGIGAILVSPEGEHYSFTSRLNFDCTNNMAEYEACVLGLRAAVERKVKMLKVYGDSALVIYQLMGEWETKDPKLVEYCKLVMELVEEFEEVTFNYLPREENQMADALATLAAAFKMNEHSNMMPIEMKAYEYPTHCFNIEEEEDGNPWYYDILQYIRYQSYLEQATENDKRTIRRMASGYVLDGETLYNKSLDQVLLRCVDAKEAKLILEEVHEGICGTHANKHAMARQIMRFGYYWSTMETDCINYARKCHKCQIYGDRIYTPPHLLHVMTAPWPFSMWGMDVIGQISPKASNGHRFILVAIDYFTKWVEVASYANVTQSTICKFLKKEIICRYGLPERIISDNALNLNNKMMDLVCKQFKIKIHNSTTYRPKMNGAVEAANKNIKRLIENMTETYKDWHEKLPFALFAYRTSVRTSTGATPFSLVYEMEAVLPIEVEIPSLRILSEVKPDEAKWVQARYEQLNLIEEKRLKAICHGQMYQKRMIWAHGKKVRLREFHEGDLVLKRIFPIQKDLRGKWMPNWEGPYVVKKAFSGGALVLTEMDGSELPYPVNSDAFSGPDKPDHLLIFALFSLYDNEQRGAAVDARFHPGTASEASYPVHYTNLDQWKPKSAQNGSVNSSPVHARRVSIVYLAMRRGVCRRLPNRIANPLKVWGVFGRVEEMTLGVYLGFLNARVDGQSERRLPRRLNGGRDRDLVTGVSVDPLMSSQAMVDVYSAGEGRWSDSSLPSLAWAVCEEERGEGSLSDNLV
ncbi:high mobility group B protein 6-like [Hibiscus syriacus]|uniref:High mobility group B protein 6-like n=1 Tax=Hibiscus syriacus TaxID=106335 RepID=A0A6A3AUQ4_HIBSY|nr:high mobility group B protein 6-like [Hibiscus syriacus]